MTLYQQTIDANTGIDASQFIPGYSHEDGIRFDKNDSVNTMMEKMADYIINILGRPLELKRILDVGSGSGALAYYLRRKAPHIEVFTLDGNRETLESPFIDKERHFIVRTDKPYLIVDEKEEVVRFDLIVSFEHIEHIQEKNFHQFLKNIQNHSTTSTIFFGMAAMWEYEEESKKHIHCNVKNIVEWRQELANTHDTYQTGILYNAAAAIQQAYTQGKIAEDEASSFIIELVHYFFDDFISTQPGTWEEIEKRCTAEMSWLHRFVSSAIILLAYG